MSKRSSRFALGALACSILLSLAVFTSAPGLAAPKAKPKPTPTATASPTPTATPTSTPTATPSPTPSTPPPAPACESRVTRDTVDYCVTTFTAIAAGRLPVGTAVAVGGAFVLDVAGTQATLGRDECPPGMFCGATLTTLGADFSRVQPPAVDSVIDIYGTVTSDFGVLVSAYTLE
ncbi:hypothetical protein ACH3VR_20110 [Microbacterium sp. B2969]|uniref:Uncharacterized protein n=1 Tax=Microbacterium alkaliflavum TaxID=3248839 RepID=A0ABW7QCR1_9MICO